MRAKAAPCECAPRGRPHKPTAPTTTADAPGSQPIRRDSWSVALIVLHFCGARSRNSGQFLEDSIALSHAQPRFRHLAARWTSSCRRALRCAFDRPGLCGRRSKSAHKDSITEALLGAKAPAIWSWDGKD